MSIDLVTLSTADGVELDGALYAARGPSSRGAVLMVHGLTWNFYRGPSRWLPPRLADAGYAVLSLNMRDHDLAEPKDFKLSHHDIRAGVDHLAALGRGRLPSLPTASRVTRSSAIPRGPAMPESDESC